MRTVIAATAVTLLALGVLSGAPRTATADTALGTSKWSLEVGTSLGTGDNIALALRRHSGASSAFRLGFEMFLAETEGEGTVTSTGNPDQDAAQMNGFYTTTLAIQWMRFAPIRDNVTATFAVGPVVEWLGQHSKSGFGAGTPGFSEGEQWFKGTSFGLDLDLGVEWFFNRRVSLGGSAGIRATIGSGSQVQINRSGTGPTYTKSEVDYDTDLKEVDTGSKIQLTGYF